MPRHDPPDTGPYFGGDDEQPNGIPDPGKVLKFYVEVLQQHVANVEGALWAVRSGHCPECHDEWLKEAHWHARTAQRLLDGCHPFWDFPLDDR